MSRRVVYRSWSKLEAGYELDKFKGLPFGHEWVHGHTVAANQEDIYLTTNGYDFRPGPQKKATLYAESYQYLKNEYNNYTRDLKWDHRFHFNPNFAQHQKSSLQMIGCFWKSEMPLFEDTIKNKKPEFLFGMVLSKKPTVRGHPCEFGWYRSEIISKAKGRSFRYYGSGWDRYDPHYAGEVYVNGHRGTPIKFHDARILMTKAKFVFAVENIHDATYAVNYLTEKIFHGFLSASVPIYAGCWNVEKIIPEDIFIDLRKFNMDVTAAMNFCEKMSESDYQGYLDRIGKWLHGPGQTFSCDERFLDLDRKLSKVFP